MTNILANRPHYPYMITTSVVAAFVSFIYFVCLFVSVYITVEGWWTTPSVNFKISRLLNTFSNLFIVVVHLTCRHIPCHVAIADCTHVHYVVNYTKISTNHIL